MNMNFAKNTYRASIDYVTSLFAATGRDGALRMPKNFGTDEEQDNEFDTFKMSFGPRLAPFLCPTAIAVHNDRNMAGGRQGPPRRVVDMF